MYERFQRESKTSVAPSKIQGLKSETDLNHSVILRI